MSSMLTSESQRTAQTSTKNKKARKKKVPKIKSNGEGITSNVVEGDGDDHDNVDQDAAEPPLPLDSHLPLQEPGSNTMTTVDGSVTLENDELLPTAGNTLRFVHPHREDQAEDRKRELLDLKEHTSTVEHLARFETVMREKDLLNEEIAEIRRSLDQLQKRYEVDVRGAREQLSQTVADKEHAEIQYQNLLGKVNTIKSQLGERLKADAEDLSQARSKIEDLEDKNATLQTENHARASELLMLAESGEQRLKELSGLRNRTTLSQQNWIRERDDLLQREILAKEEFEAAKQAMQDWEILAMEERSIRESLADKAAGLEEQVAAQRDAYRDAAMERDAQLSAAQNLQRALLELQDERRRELRDIVESSQSQIEGLKRSVNEAEGRAREAVKDLAASTQELQRVLPFENEVKEKNLLIGKLRHEAVILNDHLTKALRYLRKGKPEDTIDKRLVTNHFLQFLALERSDPKKFQVLQVMAGILAWTDEQREQAGLARPGASNPSTRIPVSPWHRTPSTPALNAEFLSTSGSRKESLAELWSGFLEQETSGDRDTRKSPPSSLGASKPA